MINSFFFKLFFQEHYQRAKRFGSRSGPTYRLVSPDLGPNCLQSYQQATKECINGNSNLNKMKEMDTNIDFGYRVLYMKPLKQSVSFQ